MMDTIDSLPLGMQEKSLKRFRMQREEGVESCGQSETALQEQVYDIFVSQRWGNLGSLPMQGDSKKEED